MAADEFDYCVLTWVLKAWLIAELILEIDPKKKSSFICFLSYGLSKFVINILTLIEHFVRLWILGVESLIRGVSNAICKILLCCIYAEHKI